MGKGVARAPGDSPMIPGLVLFAALVFVLGMMLGARIEAKGR